MVNGDGLIHEFDDTKIIVFMNAALVTVTLAITVSDGIAMGM